MNTTPTVKLANGQVVRACELSQVKLKSTKKLLIVIQYWDGDMAQVEKQIDLICDLERFKNNNVDVMLYGRRDAKMFQVGSISKLQSKFGVVHQQKCRRIGTNGYPYGANEMFYDLCHMMSEKPWVDQYFAFLNLESDCCPTKPGWTHDLSVAFLEAAADDKVMIGHYCKNHTLPHMNGVGVYSCEKTVKLFGVVAGGPANAAYDIHWAKKIVPAGKDVPEIFLDFNRKTITPDELFAPRKDGLTPVLYHGVKDDSAFNAVRDEHIVGGARDAGKNTVYTFFEQVPELDVNENHRQIDIWKNAWRSRGWKPVVLNLDDARRHKDFEKYNEAFKKLPTVNPKQYELNCFLRWLALDAVGGGFMTDYDMLPRSFIPRDLEEFQKEPRVSILQASVDGGTVVPAAVFARGPALASMIAALASYKPSKKDVEGVRPHVSDQNILCSLVGSEWMSAQGIVSEFGEQCWESAPLVHFATSAITKTRPGISKSGIMAEFVKS